MMFFQQASRITHNVVTDIVRIIRDIIALTNDFFPLPCLTAIVNALDDFLGERDQHNQADYNPL
jgi:hypothetical protein